MKVFRYSFLLLFLFAFASAQTATPKPADKTVATKPETKPEAKPESKIQMMTYQMVLFKAAAELAGAQTAKSRTPPEYGAMMQEHLANLARLNNQRINLIYGPFTDNDPQTKTMNELRGIAILDTPDAETAKKYFADDPFVKANEMVLEIKPWFGPKGWFNPPTVPPGDDPAKMQPDPLVFGILMRGPAAKMDPPIHTPEQRQEFQKGHIAYMEELNRQGKLVMAGPFMEDGDWRGIVVYRVPSVADAQALAANDPAVRAGRLAIEARQWMTLKGILK